MKNTTKTVGVMPTSSIVETCERVSKIALYILIFLLPILFLPWTANVLEFNKQALLIVAVFVAIFAWMIRVLVSGKISFNLHWIHIPMVVLFLVYLGSTIFSVWSHGSFWGWPQPTSESLLSLLGLLLFYFLIINIFERKEIFYVLSLFVLSAGLAMIYGILQIFGKFLIPIDFTKVTSFNTIGGVNNLGIFGAGLLPLIVIFLIQSKKKIYQILFGAALVISAFLFLLINFQIIWWLVIVGSVFLIAFCAQRRDVFDSRWLILPMFFLALALLFLLLKFQIPGLPQSPLEFFLRHKPSFDISFEVLKEKPVFGTGPGTFVYNFSEYKNISFNQGVFWNTRFDWASSKALTILGTVGILGALAFLALIGLFVFYAIRSLFIRAKTQNNFWPLSIGVFIAFLVLNVGFFLYSSSVCLDFAYFLMMGSLVALISPERKEFVLKPSSLITLAITFAFTLVFIFGLGVLILEGQRYIASTNYLKAIKLAAQGNSQKSLVYLEGAVRLAPENDFYWRELSQAYLQELNVISKSADLSQEEATKKIQLYINNAVNSAKTSADSNPNNVANWSVRGFIYQNLIGIVNGTADWAVTSYDKAAELEPVNPYFPTQAGVCLLKKNDIGKAKEKFEKALELKPDYAPAKDQLEKL